MFLVLFALIPNLLSLPIERVAREHPRPLEGDYLGTSAFTATNLADSGYTETASVWFEFADSTYRYGLGSDFPVPSPTQQYAYGYGPFEVTDSTVTFHGTTNKILRPAVVLAGRFWYKLVGDTVSLTQQQASFPAGQHTITLVRQE